MYSTIIPVCQRSIRYHSALRISLMKSVSCDVPYFRILAVVVVSTLFSSCVLKPRPDARREVNSASLRTYGEALDRSDKIWFGEVLSRSSCTGREVAGRSLLTITVCPEGWQLATIRVRDVLRGTQTESRSEALIVWPQSRHSKQADAGRSPIGRVGTYGVFLLRDLGDNLFGPMIGDDRSYILMDPQRYRASQPNEPLAYAISTYLLHGSDWTQLSYDRILGNVSAAIEVTSVSNVVRRLKVNVNHGGSWEGLTSCIILHEQLGGPFDCRELLARRFSYSKEEQSQLTEAYDRGARLLGMVRQDIKTHRSVRLHGVLSHAHGGGCEVLTSWLSHSSADVRRMAAAYVAGECE